LPRRGIAADPQARAPIQRDRDELAARIHQLQQEGQQLDERERQLRRENEPNRRARVRPVSPD